MAKCNQLTPLSFKGLTTDCEYRNWSSTERHWSTSVTARNDEMVMNSTCTLRFIETQLTTVQLFTENEHASTRRLRLTWFSVKVRFLCSHVVFSSLHCLSLSNCHNFIFTITNWKPFSYGWDVISENLSKSAFFEGGGSLWAQISDRIGRRLPKTVSVRTAECGTKYPQYII